MYLILETINYYYYYIFLQFFDAPFKIVKGNR